MKNKNTAADRKLKTTLRLPDLDLAKSAVLNSLPSKESQRGYRHAIEEFTAWYCSEPRLSFNKTVVTRYRIYLESRQLAPGTINGRLAAVRRLAYEAADSGLLSPELAAGIRRVKSVKKLGVRLGNRLTAEQARELWQVPDPMTLKGKRDRALLAILLGCGLRRREVAELDVARLQRREDHWAIVDLMGKGRHVRTVPVPEWVKAAIDSWLACAGISDGRLFRCVCRAGKTWGDGVSERVVWHVVKDCAKAAGIQKLAPHDLRRTCAAFAIWPVANSNRSNFSLGTSPFRQRKSISAADNACEAQSTIELESSRSIDRNTAKSSTTWPGNALLADVPLLNANGWSAIRKLAQAEGAKRCCGSSKAQTRSNA